MILPRRPVLLLWLLAAGTLAAQTPPPPAAAPSAPVFADDRAARLADRYKAMLAADPTEGLALDRLWKTYEAANATARLLEEYQRAADAAPADFAPTLLYGYCLKRAGRLDEAAAAYERAARLQPASPLPTLARAELALARSRPGDAAPLFEAAVGQLPPTDHRRVDLLLKTGDAFLAAGQPLQAADAWEKTVALAPGDLGMRRRLAENYEKNNLPARAVGHYEYIEAHADPAGRAAAFRELARLHEARGEFDAARDALERGLALTARDNWLYGDLQTRLIRLYQRAGRTPELAARWQTAAAQAPHDLGGPLRLEALAEAEGDTAGECAWLEKIVALSPRDRDTALKLARLLADTGERDHAAALYDGLLRSQPDNLDLILARADLEVQTGHPDAAAARIEARLARNPADESIVTPALEFFLAHRLDAASERVLRAQAARLPDAAEPALALAKFLFSRRQAADARRVLDDLVARPGDPAARAARWMAAADAYKEQNLTDDALLAWQQAAALQPQAAAPLLAAGDLLVARGDSKTAADRVERALALTPAGPEQEEVERKLFQILQSTGSGGATGRYGDSSVAARAISGVVGGGFPGRREFGDPRPGVVVQMDTPLAAYIEGLRKEAAGQPSAARYLRLARWQSWAGDAAEAVAAAEKAIELDAANVPARELLVTLAVNGHRREDAEQRLREIMALDPARQAACLRQIAGLEAENNELDEALAIYDELQKAAPGSVDALTDLALAQQRAERWYDALATWERAYALPGLTPARRADLRRPLLAAYERLEQFPRAAEVLEAAVDAQTDLAARQDLFHELSIFCRQHDLVPWLEKRCQDRLAAQPNDFFTLTASADLAQAAGRDRDAYRLLERAYYSSPDAAASLRTLADRAEALGENEAAIAHQRRLTTLPGQATSENLEKLADLQGANLDPDAAARTWEGIVGRFPRDPNCLERGAGFFEGIEKTGRARELLAQVIALDPDNPRRLAHLARLDAAAGNAADARALLERLLASTDPEKPGDALLPPPELDFAPDALAGLLAGMSSHRARALGLTAPVPPAESDDRHLRLDAVRDLARLLAATGSPDDRHRWQERWRAAAAAGQRSEPLAAFFFAGDSRAAMDLVTGWVHGPVDDERVRTVFFATGLRLNAYDDLAQWAWREADLTHRAERGQWLLGALQQFLNQGGKPGPGMVAGLFPPEIRLRETLWEAAGSGFADRHWYQQAAELGTRVYALVPTNRAEYALKIAQWELNVGNAAHARAVLRDAVETDRGESFEASDNAVFAALRAYVLLLPEDGRAAFADGYLQRMRDGGEQAHATLAAVLLHGLTGDERAAERDLDDLVAMRLLSTLGGGGTPDARRWNFVLNNGAQLQAWNLDGLAAYYWRRALREVSAFERQDGDATNFQAEIRGHLLSVEVALAPDPQRARERVEEYLRAGLSWEVVANEAAQLLSLSQYPSAARLYETLCRLRPADAEHWRNLLLAQESGGDQAAAERTLTALLAGPAPPPPGMTRFDLFNRLANLRMSEGDAPGACRLLERARMESPGVLPVLVQLAQADERAGRWEQAAQAWTEAVPLDPGGTSRLSLAADEGRLGRVDAAVATLREAARAPTEPTRTNAVVQLAGLYLSARRFDDARALGTWLVEEGPAGAMPPVAEALVKAGQRPFALELLATAVRRTHDPRLRFQAQSALAAQYATPGEDQAAFVREMGRLETFSRGDPALRNAFVLTRYQLARQRGVDAWLEDGLRREWDGSRGDLAAGEKLVALYLGTGREEALRDVVAAIDHHPDLPEQTLHQLEEQLVQADHGPLALPILERLRRRFPQNDRYAEDQARALWQAGRHDEAAATLEALDAMAVFREDLVGRAGSIFLELGDRARARQQCEAVARLDGAAVHHPQVDLQLARLASDEKRFAEAHRWLRQAYRNPTCVALAPIVTYLAASGQLGTDAAPRGLPGGDLPLTFTRRAELLAEVYASLTNDNRPDEARACVALHPEMLAGAPGLVGDMRRGLDASGLPALATLTEDALGQTDPPVPRLERELAALYVQMAARETADPVAAMTHLTRAHELVPDDFEVAEQLAVTCLAHDRNERAAAALAGFLVPDALPTERDRARQILSKVSPPAKEG